MDNQSSRQNLATVIRNKAAEFAKNRTSTTIPADERHTATLVDGATHENNGEESKYSLDQGHQNNTSPNSW